MKYRRNDPRKPKVSSETRASNIRGVYRKAVARLHLHSRKEVSGGSYIDILADRIEARAAKKPRTITPEEAKNRMKAARGFPLTT